MWYFEHRKREIADPDTMDAPVQRPIDDMIDFGTASADINQSIEDDFKDVKDIAHKQTVV